MFQPTITPEQHRALTQRMDRMERKLDTLLAQLAQNEKKARAQRRYTDLRTGPHIINA